MRAVSRRQLCLMLAFVVVLSLGVLPVSAQEPIVIDFYYPTAVGGPITEILEGYAAQFEEANPGIDINPVYQGDYTQLRTTVQTEMRGGGTGPDVAVMLATDLFSFVEEGYIIPAQDFIDQMEDGEAYVNDFFPALLLNSYDEDGVIWSIPFQRSTPILFYNKDQFAEVGLDPEDPPQNRDELVEYAQQLALPDGERWGLMLPVAGGFPIWLFQSFAIANGQNIVSDDPAVVTFNDPQVTEALEFMVMLGDEGVSPAGGSAWGDTPTAFTSGQASMIYHTTGSLTNILNNADFEVGVAYLPSGPANDEGLGYGTPTGGGNMYIFDDGSKTPEELDAIWRWIEFLSSPEIQADWTVQTGYIAARQSAWETDTLVNLLAEHPQYGVARDQLEYADREFSSYRAIDVQGIINTTLSSVLSGSETDAQAALDSAQAQIDSLLEEYR